MNTEHDVETIARLAQEVEITDPIDWSDLAIPKAGAYKMMAAHVAEFYDDNSELTNKAILAKLLVENFTLNLRLQQNDR